VTALPGHAALEAYSVLTRLPGGLAVPGATAAEVLATRFSGGLLELASSDRAHVLRTLASAGVSGGSAYDGLVALEAEAHERELLTLDQRALATYRRLGVRFRLIAG
jgi:toxin FitB